MKQIKAIDLQIGNIFTKKIELHGREAFEVVEKPLEKNYINVKSRSSGEITRMFFRSIYVILLKEKP